MEKGNINYHGRPTTILIRPAEPSPCNAFCYDYGIRHTDTKLISDDSAFSLPSILLTSAGLCLDEFSACFEQTCFISRL